MSPRPNPNRVYIPNVINVLAYGAHGDGITDDTAHIAAAVAAWRPGYTLYFPGGRTYLGALTATAGMKIKGDGATSYVSGRIITAPHTDWRNLKMGVAGQLYGNAYDGGPALYDIDHNGVYFTGGLDGAALVRYGERHSAYDIRHANCTFDRCDGAGNSISISSYSKTGQECHHIDILGCLFITPSRCAIEAVAYSEDADSTIPFTSIDAIGNTIQACDYMGISYAFNKAYGGGSLIHGYSEVSRNTIADAGVVTADAHGIECKDGFHMTVSANTVQGSHVGNMLSISGASDAGHSSYCVFDGNSFLGQSSAHSRLFMKNVTGDTLTNNTFRGRYSAYMEHVHSITSQGNDYARVDADNAIITTGYAVEMAGVDGPGTFTSDTFESRYNSGAIYGWHATNHVHATDCTWHQDATDPYYYGTFEDFTNTNPTQNTTF